MYRGVHADRRAVEHERDRLHGSDLIPSG
jgi:hypothetical protein